MNKYVCTSCKREVIVSSKDKELNLFCCKGKDNPVKFVLLSERPKVVAAVQMPNTVALKGPLPPSTVAPVTQPAPK